MKNIAVDNLLKTVKKLSGQLVDFKQKVVELEKIGNLTLEEENKMLRGVLQPILDVKFKKTSGRVATWFKEAVEHGKPSIRIFIKDYENARKAIDAVTKSQTLWDILIKGKP